MDRARPTVRCLKHDLHLAMPPVDIPLDEIDHPLLAKTNEQFADPGGAARRRSPRWRDLASAGARLRPGARAATTTAGWPAPTARHGSASGCGLRKRPRASGCGQPPRADRAREPPAPRRRPDPPRRPAATATPRRRRPRRARPGRGRGPRPDRRARRCGRPARNGRARRRPRPVGCRIRTAGTARRV